MPAFGRRTARNAKNPAQNTTACRDKAIIGMTACGESADASSLKPGSNDELILSDSDYSDMNNWLSFGGDTARVLTFSQFIPPEIKII